MGLAVHVGVDLAGALFPGNVEASLVVNSGIDGGANPCSLLAAAIKSGS
ncbi:hypothetical protein [Saccharothrix sp.]|nr:hypothetical protein [Saccharothrix sp.]